jgi:hypothetical protein
MVRDGQKALRAIDMLVRWGVFEADEEGDITLTERERRVV